VSVESVREDGCNGEHNVRISRVCAYHGAFSLEATLLCELTRMCAVYAVWFTTAGAFRGMPNQARMGTMNEIERAQTPVAVPGCISCHTAPV
jgi:hypothetical protein